MTLAALKKRDQMGHSEWSADNERISLCRPRRREASFRQSAKEDIISLEMVKELFTTKAALVSARAEAHRARLHVAELATDLLESIVEATSRLFGDDVKIYTNCDPDNPDDSAVVFEVNSSLDLSGIMDAEDAWNETIVRLAPNQTKIRLLVNAVR